jgi:preprotein translocase subunit SecF
LVVGITVGVAIIVIIVVVVYKKKMAAAAVGAASSADLVVNVKNQPTYVEFDSLQEMKKQKQFEMGVVDA